MGTFRDPDGFDVLSPLESDNRLSPGASALIILGLSALSWGIVISVGTALSAML